MPNNLEIWTLAEPKEEKFLRQKTEPFDFAKHSSEEITELIRRMRKIMRAANGVGLAANQIGLPWRVFVAEMETEKGKKFYAIFNPRLEKLEGDKEYGEEGCLSVPQKYGDVPRGTKVVLTAQDSKGRPIKLKAWGFLARIFQHETDHLEGHLFIDRTKHVYPAEEGHPSRTRK